MTDGQTGRIADYLRHMQDAITRIETYVADIDQAAFQRTNLVQDAVIRNFEIIGEAASKILQADPAFRSSIRSCAWTSLTACATP